jgi:hypothetical protein
MFIRRNAMERLPAILRAVGKSTDKHQRTQAIVIEAQIEVHAIAYT